MKDLFPGYYPPTDQELSDLWKDCIFVLDANVLLNLYRYSKETAAEFLNILSKISDRLWIPHQVALEYHKRRLEVISQQKKAYDEAQERMRKISDEIKNRFLSKRHPFIREEKALIGKLEVLLTEIEQQLEDGKSDCLSIIGEDNIKDSITSLFEGKVGQAYSNDKLKEIYEIGKKRYGQKIPPGYEDVRNKSGDREYGDLIIWFQVIDYGQENKKPMILITDEKKDDWWLKFDGKIIGPRPELRSEIADKAQVQFYMYRIDPFMEHAQKFLKQRIKQKAIEEVRETRRQDEKNYANTLEITQALKYLYPHERLQEMGDYIKPIQDLNRPGLLSELTRYAEAIKSSYAPKYLEELHEYAKHMQDLTQPGLLNELTRQFEVLKHFQQSDFKPYLPELEKVQNGNQKESTADDDIEKNKNNKNPNEHDSE